jgi:hypothetical protein
MECIHACRKEDCGYGFTGVGVDLLAVNFKDKVVASCESWQSF